jgi:hypothetical protein
MSHAWSAQGGFFANADFDYEAPMLVVTKESELPLPAHRAPQTHAQMLDWLADRLPKTSETKAAK